MLLEARIMRDGKPIYHALAFNDVVVNRSGFSGMAELRVSVDGHFMYNQRSDGLIVATPTGSTAYALSSPGPILHPQLQGIVLVPIAPHALSNRPIVLPDDSKVSIQIIGGRDVNVNFDMQSFTVARTERHDRGAPLAPYGADAASGRLQLLRHAAQEAALERIPVARRRPQALSGKDAGTRTPPLPKPDYHAHQTTSMLRHLSIRDFVIVAALDLEFDSGFTVFSGETGAGKSILIDALALALGARADASVVRTGEARADITAEFETHARSTHWLDEQALGTTGDDGHHGGTVMLRRVVDANGRSRAFINGTAATLAQLREVGEMLVDIHGQHAHQLLMRPDAQRELFDTHAGLSDTRRDRYARVAHVARAAQAVEHAQTRDRELQLERERLAWQLDRTRQARAATGRVGRGQRRAPPAVAFGQSDRRRARRARRAVRIRRGDDHAAFRRSSRSCAISPTSIRRSNDVLAALEPAEIQLQEAAYSLSTTRNGSNSIRTGCAQVETAPRRAAFDRAQVPSAARNAAGGTRGASRATRRSSTPPPTSTACTPPKPRPRKTYLAEAKKLSKARAKAGKALGAAVTTGMQELSMAGGSFEVALVPLPEGGAHGLEQVEFRVAGHAGVPLRPLAKVASGGELARISLALAVIASAASPTPTLIFDEVDTGIGGGVAEVVGRLLHQLGQRPPGAVRDALAASRRARRSAFPGGEGGQRQRRHGQQRHLARQGEPRRGSRAHARRARNHADHAQAREGNAGGVRCRCWQDDNARR